MKTTNKMRRRRGIALIMVLMLLTLLVVIVGQLSYTTKIDGYIARNASDDLQNRYALISAVNYAIAALQVDALQEEKEEAKYDALTDVWGVPGKLTVSDTAVTYTITDENSKFDLLHLLQKEFQQEEKKKDEEVDDDDEEEESESQGDEETPNPKIITPAEQFDRLVGLLQADQNLVKIQAKTLREAVLSWMKEKRGQDNLPGPFQNKVPMLSVKELLLVRGVSPAMLYGLDGELSEKFPGLTKCVTVWSDGKINVNTANVKVLQSLCDKIDDDLSKRLATFREKGNDKGGKAFASLKEFQDFLVAAGSEENSVYPQIKDLITVRSHFFTIEATAKTGRVTKKLTVVVYRNGKRVYKLYADYHE